MAFSSILYAWKVLASLHQVFLQRLENVATYNNPDNGYCALLLTLSGKVFSTGKSIFGCLGLGEVRETAVPVELKELSGVAGVCVCGCFGDALAYTREGKVYVWGNNAKPTLCNRPQLVPELTDIVDAICNRGHYLALTKSGMLYEWRGVNTCNRVLNGLSTSPRVVALNKVITSIACGPFHALALTKDGEVYSWGKNVIKGFVDQRMTKILLPGETVAKVACGTYHSLVLTHTGKLYTWGCNDYGLGDASGSTESATPVEVGQNIGRFVDVAVNGRDANAAVSQAGAVYMWGEGENDAEVKTARITQCKEMHQVFAKLLCSQYSWTCTTKSSLSNNTVPVVVKDLSIAAKLKAIFNYDQDCNEAQIHHVKDVDNLKNELAKLKEDKAKLTEENDKLKDELKHVNAKLQEKLEDNTKLKNKLKEDNTKLKDELKEDNANLKEELKEDNAKFKSELKEDNTKLKYELKEDNTKLKDELKEDNAKLKEELKEDNAKFKDELKEDNAKLKEELKEDNAKFKSELKEDNAKLKDGLIEDNAKLKDELKEDIAKLKDELKEQLENLKALLLSQEGKKNCSERKFRGEEGGTSSRPPIL